ncbi:MAG TPA: NmrA family transcriptional regulator [Micromonosporaceae bacterium]|nr:NmrA family transcriptional regulator [Micromonosporaceae bacterium]
MDRLTNRAFTSAMTNNTKSQQLTLVTGATGKTGRRVADRLIAADVPVRLGTRSGDTPFDWADESTWEPALRGVKQVYVAYYPDLAAPGAGETIKSFAELAVSVGATRLVLLSGRGEEEAQRSEQIVRESGADWTIVRCSWFSQNFSEAFFLESLLSGEIHLPASDVGEPFVDVDDIADVAAAALSEDGHVGQLYELTGPGLWTFKAAISEIAKASGREIRLVPVSIPEFAAGLAEAAVPDEFVEFLTYLFTEVLDGRNAHVTDGVQKALGRQPRDFADFAREAAATGIWAPERNLP